MADIDSLIATGIRSPQVETLGDAFARMRANQQARAEGAQRLTLGDLATQEGRLKLKQMQIEAEADQRGRELFAGGSPQSAQIAPPPQNGAPEASPAPAAQAPAPITYENGSAVQRLSPDAPPAQAPAPQASPAPGAQPVRPTPQQIFRAYGPVRGAAIVKAMTEADTAGVDLATKKSKLGADLLDYEGSLAGMVKAANYSQDAVDQAILMLAQHGYPEEAAQLRAHIAQDPTQIKALMDQAIAASPKQRELANADATAKREADLAPSKLSEAKSNAGILENKLKQIQNPDPVAFGALIDSVAPAGANAQLNLRMKAQVNFALSRGDIEGAKLAITNGAEQVGAVEKATSVARATAPIEIAKSVATAKALAPIEVQRAVDQQIALAKQSPDAFAGIFDPTARHKAENDYDAASKEYAGKVATARQLTDLITAAQNGNKAAPGVIPLQELRGFVNRVNSTELKAVGSGAGSSLDKIEGWLKGAAEGQPIPSDILAATKDLAALQEKAAKRGYDFNLQIIRQKGAKVQPIELPGDTPAAASATKNPFRN